MTRVDVNPDAPPVGTPSSPPMASEPITVPEDATASPPRPVQTPLEKAESPPPQKPDGIAKPPHKTAEPASRSRSAHAQGPGTVSTPSDTLYSCTSLGDGSIDVIFPKKGAETPRFWLQDEVGTMTAVRPAMIEDASVSGVNLLRTSEHQPRWELRDHFDQVTLGKNISDAWRLPDHDTHFIHFTRDTSKDVAEAAAVVCNPTGGTTVPLVSGTNYRFSILVSVHRCDGHVKVEIISNTGDILSKIVHPIDRSRLGGQTADKYDRVEIDFTASIDGSVRISVVKGATIRGDDSYLFFACPSLAALPIESKVRDVSKEMLLHLAGNAGIRAENAGIRLYSARIPVPVHFFNQRNQIVRLIVEAENERHQFPKMELLLDLPIILSGFLHQNGHILLHGTRLGSDAADVRLGMFVDEELSVQTTVGSDEDTFSRNLLLDPRHLDGRPHQVEIRLMPGQFSLSCAFEILPYALTPWQSVREYSRAPFTTIEANPSAAHHLRSYRAWARCGIDRKVPPLTQLHDELLQGFKKRTAYPHLSFETAGSPKVSVVIPVRDKFEVTYFCLCALLFAYNETSFEVIVVDDGSTDITTELEEIVSGVRVVRHSKSLGFVDACNDGAAIAAGNYIVFLNNDTEVTAGWLDALANTFESFENIGLAGSKLLYPDGKLQEAGGVVWRSGNPWNVGRNGNPRAPQFSYLRQVDYISGAALMVATDVWREVGGFSPDMAPGYFEDTDLAMNIRSSGRRVVFVPNSIVFHYEGQSSGTSTDSGMKRFQEVNRPKFKRKWVESYRHNGIEGQQLWREKDRNIAFRVLMVDYQFPQVDSDAGSYAAFQEIRLLQSMGGKVTFLPRNLAWMDRHTAALEAVGVECLYTPFVQDIFSFIKDRTRDYDLVYITRFRIAEELVASIRQAAPAAKIILNLADLHFLRELREAMAGSEVYTIDKAKETREAELKTIESVDLTLSYTDVEIAVIESHLGNSAKVAKLPWIAPVNEGPRAVYGNTKDILFLGGFAHHPNRGAVKFFVHSVLPRLRQRLPDIRFRIAGTGIPQDIADLQSDAVEILGFVPDLSEVLSTTRVFVAPLLAGAGIKGKVAEALTHGVPSVLSPIAAEGIGLSSGHDCFIANTVEDWVDRTASLYSDEQLWNRMSEAAKATARIRFSFSAGQDLMRSALAQVDIFGSNQGLVYKHPRPRLVG